MHTLLVLAEYNGQSLMLKHILPDSRSVQKLVLTEVGWLCLFCSELHALPHSHAELIRGKPELIVVMDKYC